MTDEHEADFRSLYRDLRIREQHVYYRQRRDEYQRAHRQAVLVRNLLLMVAGVCSVAGQAVEGAARAGWSVGAAVLAGLAAAVIGYEALLGFSRLSTLYGDVARNLAEADLDWADAATSAQVAREMVRVEEVIRVENGQWGQLVVEAADTRAADPPSERPDPPAGASAVGGRTPA